LDIVWLRDDFRVDDQPAIAAAAERPALFVYVHDETPSNGRPPGGAARWRLGRSLAAMEPGLAARGARLDVLEGDAGRTILALAAAAKAGRVLWTRRYEGDAIALDGRVKAALSERSAEALSFNGRLLREPRELARADNRPPGVFSAFWR
jgi:deoxyribodipyrimidine photo-lyase